MKQLKELWTLVNNWLGNGKKMHHWFGVSSRWVCHELVFSSGRGTFSDSVYLDDRRRFVPCQCGCFRSGQIKISICCSFVLAFICVMDLGIVLLDGDFSQFTTMVTVTCAAQFFFHGH